MTSDRNFVTGWWWVDLGIRLLDVILICPIYFSFHQKYTSTGCLLFKITELTSSRVDYTLAWIVDNLAAILDKPCVMDAARFIN